MIDYDAEDYNGYHDGDFHQQDDGASSIGARILAIPGESSAGPPVPAMTQPQDFSGAPSTPWRLMDAQRQQQMMETAALPQAQAQDTAPAPSFASQTPPVAVPPPAPRPVAVKPPQATPPRAGGTDRPQPSNSAGVRVVDRQGNITTIPRSAVNEARRNGMMVTPDNGVRMITPDGQITYALPEEVDQFRASGHVPLNDNGYFRVDPLPGENAADTMARAARIAKNLPPEALRKAIEAEKKTLTADRIVNTLVAAPVLGAAGTAGFIGAGELLGPVGVTETVGTGLYDAAGDEIMREAVRYGPGLLRRVATSRMGKTIGLMAVNAAFKSYFNYLFSKWKEKK